MDGVAGIDPAQRKGSKGNSSQDFAQDRGQPNALKQLSCHLRGNEDNQEL
jgi:hypothetical protein